MNSSLKTTNNHTIHLDDTRSIATAIPHSVDARTFLGFTLVKSRNCTRKLARCVKGDAVRYPNGILVEGMKPSVAEKDEPEDDFFTSWSKPNIPKSPNPGTPLVSTPLLGRTTSANSTTSPSPT